MVISLFALGIFSGKCQSLEWLCRPGDFDEIKYAGYDMFRVKTQQGKWGLLHSDGKMIIPAEYDSITPFIENRALLLEKSSKRLLGIINPKGNFIKDFSTNKLYVSRFPQYKEGRLAFSTGDGYFGYLNENGEVAIEPRFYLAAPFQDGIAAVQYNNTEYGVIRKDGRSAIVSDDRFYFMSSPVDGKVLAVKGSRKGGDQLLMMRIDGTSLKKDKVLEDGMNINLSDDFTSLECQLGHSYYLDDQWRINSASYPAPIPLVLEEKLGNISEDSSVLSRKQTPEGVQITHNATPIANNKFKHVSTYDKKYAIVNTMEGKNGIVKLNPSSDISIISPNEPVIFHHNEPKDISLDVNLINLEPSKIFIKDNDGVSSNNYTLKHIDGKWKLIFPYFKSSDKYEERINEKCPFRIEYDGLDWKHYDVNIISLHKPGFTVDLIGSSSTNENGNAVLKLNIKAINGKNASGSITVNGGKPISFSKGEKSIPFNITIPEGATKTFSYSVKIKEEGCPEFTTTVSKSVSNPKTVSNPTKKPMETKEHGKKKIIIQ